MTQKLANAKRPVRKMSWKYFTVSQTHLLIKARHVCDRCLLLLSRPRLFLLLLLLLSIVERWAFATIREAPRAVLNEQRNLNTQKVTSHYQLGHDSLLFWGLAWAGAPVLIRAHTSLEPYLVSQWPLTDMTSLQTCVCVCVCLRACVDQRLRWLVWGVLQFNLKRWIRGKFTLFYDTPENH